MKYKNLKKVELVLQEKVEKDCCSYFNFKSGRGGGFNKKEEAKISGNAEDHITNVKLFYVIIKL